MKSDDRVDGMEVEALRGRPEGQAGYRVLGRYGDVLNAARGYRPGFPALQSVARPVPSAAIVASSESTSEGTW
jgi:hypothetical protein